MSLTLCAGSLNQGKMIALEQAYTWLGPETAFSVWMLEFMLENLGIYCEAQARVRQGSARDGPIRRKALKLKPEPRAYIKVGCHHPPTTTRKSHYT